jgi:hypothetical protein
MIALQPSRSARRARRLEGHDRSGRRHLGAEDAALAGADDHVPVDDDVVHRAHGRQGLAGEDDPAERHAGQAPQRLFLGPVLELPQTRRARRGRDRRWRPP